MTNPTALVKIFIDNKEFESPSPTTGEALYRLGNIDPAKFDLFRETGNVTGDELIPDDGATVALKDGDRFFSVQKKLNPGSSL
jgi:hypothetical protein